MDFKKCSEVYGYKSIAEVEEEEHAEKLQSIAKAMFDAGKITREDATHFFDIPKKKLILGHVRTIIVHSH